MNEQQNNGLSVSFRIDDDIIEHNNRSFIAKNVVRERIPDNITYKKQNIREFYSELFGEALAEYNSRMKRRDRIISDYYEHIRKGKQEKTFEEIIVQFGDINDCSVGSENGELAKLPSGRCSPGLCRCFLSWCTPVLFCNRLQNS